MPTYQYTCTECAHDLEVVQKFTDDALVECPECAGRLRKVFSAVGVVFKGSGFYRTDSREKKTSSTPAASGEKAGSGSDKSGSDKSASDKAKANSEHSSPVSKKDSSSSSSSSDKGSSAKKGSESAA